MSDKTTDRDTRQTTSEGMLETLVLGPYTMSSTVPGNILDLRNLVAQRAISKINEMEKALKLIAFARTRLKRISKGEMWCRSIAEKALNK